MTVTMPERVYLIVVEQAGERDPDRMLLLTREEGGVRTTPVFSSMLLATTFLSQAQELGHHVTLDYIFPADGRRLAADFPEYQIQLDPSPRAFFPSGAAG
jgi:hypothetical protein